MGFNYIRELSVDEETKDWKWSQFIGCPEMIALSVSDPNIETLPYKSKLGNIQ